MYSNSCHEFKFELFLLTDGGGRRLVLHEQKLEKGEKKGVDRAFSYYAGNF